MFRKLERKIRKYFPKKFKYLGLYRSAVKGKKGIEIGGPSLLFGTTGILPLYDCIAQLDGCNYGDYTVWEGELKEGNTFKFGNKTGHQFIAESTDLSVIHDRAYDIVLSCHCLEHIANPVKAIYEWKRILNTGGYLVLVLPHKDRTFDHNRPVTLLNHIVEDYKNNVDEKDKTHFNEIMALHDRSQEEAEFSLAALERRLLENYENRCAHHHVFDSHLTAQLLDYAGFKLINVHAMSNSIFALAQVVDTKADNITFFKPDYPVYNNARYPSDFSYHQRR